MCVKVCNFFHLLTGSVVVYFRAQPPPPQWLISSPANNFVSLQNRSSAIINWTARGIDGRWNLIKIMFFRQQKHGQGIFVVINLQYKYVYFCQRVSLHSLTISSCSLLGFYMQKPPNDIGAPKILDNHWCEECILDLRPCAFLDYQFSCAREEANGCT